MDNKNSTLLFEYLKSILYDSEVKKLDVESLDEDFRRLGLGLQYLEKAISEMKDYSANLSKGNLTIKEPPRDNPLCENLKNIHANLNHLTWQAKQVAKGDYSQAVSYLGDFSKAFNTMTKQLEEREKKLIEENDRANKYAHMLNLHNQELEIEAHQDELTQIGNRHFFLEKMSEFICANEKFILCYCDLDNLKYINDKFGHTEGDSYLRSFVEIVNGMIREDDVFARIGGDEFCMILPNCRLDVAERKIIRMQESFKADHKKPYPKDFSCGVLAVSEGHCEQDVMELLKLADDLMYEQKKAHKRDKTAK